MKSQTERKSDPKALKLKYPSSTQTPNLKNPVKLSSPSSVDEVGARAAWGSCAAPGSCIWWLRWWRPVHLVVEVVFLFLGLKHEKERAAFLGFFSSSASSIFFFFGSWLWSLDFFDFFVGVGVFYPLINRVFEARSLKNSTSATNNP